MEEETLRYVLYGNICLLFEIVIFCRLLGKVYLNRSWFKVAHEENMLLYRTIVLLQETTFLYIPNNAVGAIIGTKGTHIRNIIRFSGASVKIAPLEQDKPQDQQTERKVTIIGSPESQWKVLPMFSLFWVGTDAAVSFVLHCRHGT